MSTGRCSISAIPISLRAAAAAAGVFPAAAAVGFRRAGAAACRRRAVRPAAPVFVPMPVFVAAAGLCRAAAEQHHLQQHPQHDRHQQHDQLAPAPQNNTAAAAATGQTGAGPQLDAAEDKGRGDQLGQGGDSPEYAHQYKRKNLAKQVFPVSATPSRPRRRQPPPPGTATDCSGEQPGKRAPAGNLRDTAPRAASGQRSPGRAAKPTGTRRRERRT